MLLTHSKEYAKNKNMSIEELMRNIRPQYDIPSYLNQADKEWNDLIAI